MIDSEIPFIIHHPIMASGRKYWWWILGSILIIGIFLEVRERQAVQITNIQWSANQIGICQVSFTAMNVSQKHLQAYVNIDVFTQHKEAKSEEETILLYDRIGKRRVVIQLPPRQSQNITYDVDILPIFPVSIKRVDINIGKTLSDSQGENEQ